MDAILYYYFHVRINQIQTSSQSASTGRAMSAEDVESVDVSKEIFEVLNTSFKVKAQPALLENNDLNDTTQNKMETLFQHIITLEAQEKDKKFDDIMALAITYFNMGLIYSELQKLDIGETHFTTCMKLLKEKELERKAIMTVIKVLHELHYISYKCEQQEKSCSFLYTAMELYSRYTKEEIEYPDPINFNAILGKLLQADSEENPNSKIALENLHSITLLNMSRLYKEHPRDKHKFAIYVHNILKQIEVEGFSVPYVTGWIITSSHLSQYFVHNYRFTEARNYLIAAECLMEAYCQIMKDIELINEKHKSDLDTSLLKLYEYACNIVTKFWMLYGAELLIASADGLLPKEENNKSYETDNSKSESVVGSEGTFTNLLIISTIKKKKLENFIPRFPDKCVSNFNDAKVIFMDVLKCFQKARKYFTIEEHFEDHMEIIMAISKVLNGLATFAQDKDMKCSLHYWRKKILSDFGKLEVVESALKSLNASTRFQFETMILNEVIEVFTTLLNIKTEHLLLNVEQLNRDFTEDLKTNHINPLVEKLIFLFGFTTRNIDKNLNY